MPMWTQSNLQRDGKHSLILAQVPNGGQDVHQLLKHEDTRGQGRDAAHSAVLRHRLHVRGCNSQESVAAEALKQQPGHVRLNQRLGKPLLHEQGCSRGRDRSASKTENRAHKHKHGEDKAGDGWERQLCYNSLDNLQQPTTVDNSLNKPKCRATHSRAKPHTQRTPRSHTRSHKHTHAHTKQHTEPHTVTRLQELTYTAGGRFRRCAGAG